MNKKILFKSIIFALAIVGTLFIGTILLVSNVSAFGNVSVEENAVVNVFVDDFVVVDKLSNVSFLENSFKTKDVEVIKDSVFTELKVNDEEDKKAVFSVDKSKIDTNSGVDIVFNEVCGKVKSYEVVSDGNDYTLTADIENEWCFDGSFGYKVDWIPKVVIGGNELYNEEWAWWNYSYSEAHGIAGGSSTGVGDGCQRGFKFRTHWNATVNRTMLYQVTKHASSTATTGILYNSAFVELARGTFSSSVATLNYTMSNNTVYYITAGRDCSASYNQWGWSAGLSFPYNGVYLDWINGTYESPDNTWFDIDSQAFNIVSMQLNVSETTIDPVGYFNISFIMWNGSYALINATLTNGSSTWTFNNGSGRIQTNITINDTSLWNISLIGNNYYYINYTSYNVSNHLVLNTTLTYSFNSSTGYFGETSDIILNLSKNSNQSYSNAKLIYNRTVYSSPTQTDYTNYTLLTQEVSNNAIGNFSYYWNVSLTDYGSQFNFSTINSSHVVLPYIIYLNFTNSTSIKITDNTATYNYTNTNVSINADNLQTGIVTISWNSDRQIQEFYNDQMTNLSFYLYNTGTTFDTSKTFLVTDFTEELENALVTAQIWITSASMWRNVYGKLTNTEGLAEVMLNTNNVYRIKVIKEGYDDYYKIVSTTDTSTDIIRIDLTNGEGTYSAMVDSNCINYAYINQTCYVSIICGDTCTYTYINVTRTISGANTTSSTQTTTTTGTTYGISLPNGTTNIYINTGTSETGEEITLTPEVIDEITNRSMASSNLTNAFMPDSIKGNDDRVKIYAILIMLIGAIIMGVAERKIAMGIGIWAGIAWFLLWSIAIPILSILALIMFSIKVIPILYKRFFVN